jgi:hypothetical protein
LFAPEFALTKSPFKGVGFEYKVNLADKIVAFTGIELKSNLKIPLSVTGSPPLVQEAAVNSGAVAVEVFVDPT